MMNMRGGKRQKEREREKREIHKERPRKRERSTEEQKEGKCIHMETQLGTVHRHSKGSSVGLI